MVGGARGAGWRRWAVTGALITRVCIIMMSVCGRRMDAEICKPEAEGNKRRVEGSA